MHVADDARRFGLFEFSNERIIIVDPDRGFREGRAGTLLRREGQAVRCVTVDRPSGRGGDQDTRHGRKECMSSHPEFYTPAVATVPGVGATARPMAFVIARNSVTSRAN